MDSQRRSIIKTITYRILGSGITFCLAYIMTGSWQVSGAISISEIIIKPIGFWVHERLWNQIPRENDEIRNQKV
jgi:uncharacterized membrane protein